ncbi:MAG: deoxynucleoside kinase [Bacteroidetes bacterium]|nr:deoxynucleoside kinase [Bacteroidota bacterium]
MYISIEGNIGSGKSTMAKALSQKLKAAFLPERFEENPLLPLFYKDPKTYAFPVEYSFLIDRQKQMAHHFAGKPKLTVSDYSMFKCIYFAEINMSAKDFRFYKKHFSAISSTVPKPDFIIYLDVKPALLLHNIKARGRDYEKGIKAKYLHKIDKTYKKRLVKEGVPIHFLTIDSYKKETMDRYVKDICILVKDLHKKHQ